MSSFRASRSRMPSLRSVSKSFTSGRSKPRKWRGDSGDFARAGFDEKLTPRIAVDEEDEVPDEVVRRLNDFHESASDELGLQWCDMNDAAARWLCRRIKGSTRVKARLRSLDLGFNSIGDGGVQAIAQLLLELDCGITTLSLRENVFGSAGANALLLAMPSVRLRCLDFRGGNIPAQDRDDLDALCKKLGYGTTFEAGGDGAVSPRSIVGRYRAAGGAISPRHASTVNGSMPAPDRPPHTATSRQSRVGNVSDRSGGEVTGAETTDCSVYSLHKDHAATRKAVLSNIPDLTKYLDRTDLLATAEAAVDSVHTIQSVLIPAEDQRCSLDDAADTVAACQDHYNTAKSRLVSLMAMEDVSCTAASDTSATIEGTGAKSNEDQVSAWASACEQAESLAAALEKHIEAQKDRVRVREEVLNHQKRFSKWSKAATDAKLVPVSSKGYVAMAQSLDEVLQLHTTELMPALSATTEALTHLIKCARHEQAVVAKIVDRTRASIRTVAPQVHVGIRGVSVEAPASDAALTKQRLSKVRSDCTELRGIHRSITEVKHSVVELEAARKVLDKLEDDRVRLEPELAIHRRRRDAGEAAAVQQQIGDLDAQIGDQHTNISNLLNAVKVQRRLAAAFLGVDGKPASNIVVEGGSAGTGDEGVLENAAATLDDYRPVDMVNKQGDDRWVQRMQSPTGKEVAVKCVAMEFGSVDKNWWAVASTQHPKICPVEAVFATGPAHMCVVTPFCAQGNLRAWVKSFGAGEKRESLIEGRLTVINDIRRRMIAVFGAVAHLHQAGVAHLSVKPENALFVDSDRQQIVIVDYGLISDPFAAYEAVSSTHVASYVAPEARTREMNLVKRNGPSKPAVADDQTVELERWRSNPFALDAWALGIWLAECLLGEPVSWNDKLGHVANQAGEDILRTISDGLGIRVSPKGPSSSWQRGAHAFLEGGDAPPERGIDMDIKMRQGFDGCSSHNPYEEGRHRLSEAWTLVDGLLRTSPEERMTVQEALVSDFFAVATDRDTWQLHGSLDGSEVHALVGTAAAFLDPRVAGAGGEPASIPRGFNADSKHSSSDQGQGFVRIELAGPIHWETVLQGLEDANIADRVAFVVDGVDTPFAHVAAATIQTAFEQGSPLVAWGNRGWLPASGDSQVRVWRQIGWLLAKCLAEGVSVDLGAHGAAPIFLEILATGVAATLKAYRCDLGGLVEQLSVFDASLAAKLERGLGCRQGHYAAMEKSQVGTNENTGANFSGLAGEPLTSTDPLHGTLFFDQLARKNVAAYECAAFELVGSRTAHLEACNEGFTLSIPPRWMRLLALIGRNSGDVAYLLASPASFDDSATARVANTAVWAEPQDHPCSRVISALQASARPALLRHVAARCRGCGGQGMSTLTRFVVTQAATGESLGVTFDPGSRRVRIMAPSAAIQPVTFGAKLFLELNNPSGRRVACCGCGVYINTGDAVTCVRLHATCHTCLSAVVAARGEGALISSDYDSLGPASEASAGDSPAGKTRCIACLACGTATDVCAYLQAANGPGCEAYLKALVSDTSDGVESVEALPSALRRRWPAGPPPGVLVDVARGHMVGRILVQRCPQTNCGASCSRESYDGLVVSPCRACLKVYSRASSEPLNIHDAAKHCNDQYSLSTCESWEALQRATRSDRVTQLRTYLDLFLEDLKDCNDEKTLLFSQRDLFLAALEQTLGPSLASYGIVWSDFAKGIHVSSDECTKFPVPSEKNNHVTLL